MKKHYIVFLVLTAALVGTEYWLQNRLTWNKENKRLGGFEAHRYYHPAPSVGEWAAIYSADFAKKFNLPESGISQEPGDNIEYMEVISVPAKKLDKFNERYPNQDCILNIVTNKNHDIPLAERSSSIKGITAEQRIENQKAIINDRMMRIDKPLQFPEKNNKYDASYRVLYAFDFIHSPDVLPGYDYFSKQDFRCQSYLTSLRHNTEVIFNRYLRASTIKERAKKSFHVYLKNEVRNVGYRKNEDDIFITITIPEILAEKLYEGTEVPPEPTHALINSVIDVPKVIAALPFALLMGLGAPDVDNSGSATIGLSAEWPKGTPTHFKLEKNE